MTIKKGDHIQVIAGREKGKQGTVERITPGASRIVVAGLNMRKRHLKPTQSRPTGGIIEVAAPISRSNLMIICPHCSKPTRAKHILTETGEKYRACIHCSDSLDVK